MAVDKEIWSKIYALQDVAQQDEKYMALYTAYVPAQERFTEFYQSLPQQQQEIVDAYLQGAVALHHRLLALACE